MGFKVASRMAVLEFDEASGFQGAEIRCRLDITTEAFLQLERLKAAADGASEEERIREMLGYFAENILLDWNLEDEAGGPLPVSADTILSVLPPGLTMRLIPLWREAAMGGPSAPLDEPSSSGKTSEDNQTQTPASQS